MHGAQVTVFIKEYGNKKVFVFGHVNKPGAIEISTETRLTVLEAISQAGGFASLAAPDRTRKPVFPETAVLLLGDSVGPPEGLDKLTAGLAKLGRGRDGPPDRVSQNGTIVSIQTDRIWQIFR